MSPEKKRNPQLEAAALALVELKQTAEQMAVNLAIRGADLQERLDAAESKIAALEQELAALKAAKEPGGKKR